MARSVRKNLFLIKIAYMPRTSRGTQAGGAIVNTPYHKANLLPAIKKRRGRVANRPGHNLLIRLSNYREDVLRFLHAPEVPFTNNEAERDLRMMKCKQKISGGFRSAHGANQFARIRGFINTMRKQGLNRLKAIQSIFSGDIMLAAGCQFYPNQQGSDYAHRIIRLSFNQ